MGIENLVWLGILCGNAIAVFIVLSLPGPDVISDRRSIPM